MTKKLMGSGPEPVASRSHTDRSSNLRIRPEIKPPRTWAAMLDAWGALLTSLEELTATGCCGPVVEQDLPLLAGMTWRWMWALPPCSEARKAAFTLGHAALLIERWRGEKRFVPGACEGCRAGEESRGHSQCSRRDLLQRYLAEGWTLRGESLGENGWEAEIESPPDSAIGHAAERELRIAAWHIDDARGERAATDARGERAATDLHGAPGPSIPPHERVYNSGPSMYADRGGVHFLGDLHRRDALSVAQVILGDHPWRHGTPPAAAILSFTETAIASLPDGPWVMTTRDVTRFLDMLLEKHAAGKGAADAYHAHLDRCERCSSRPFDLCQEGADLLRVTVRP